MALFGLLVVLVMIRPSRVIALLAFAWRDAPAITTADVLSAGLWGAAMLGGAGLLWTAASRLFERSGR